MNDGLLVFARHRRRCCSIILVVVIWQLAVTWRAKAALVREGEYRQLGERAVASHEETQRQLDGIASHLADARAPGLIAIEKSLTVID